jgi:hypothetical protein
MQQRSEPHDSLDDFPTPPWAARALIEYVIDPACAAGVSCWEPACNRGYMTRPLSEYFAVVHASDIHDYGTGAFVGDFLFPASFPNGQFGSPEWIITNPPFRLAEQFIIRAREIATIGCAVIVRTSFLEGVGRYKGLFKETPPNIIAQFCERVPMVKGRYDPDASTATSYAWMVWINGLAGTEFVWIPPCRKQLERASDIVLSADEGTP